MQKRVFVVYFSIIRRKAICAVDVIASASSRMMSLKEASELAMPPESLSGLGLVVNICFVLLKVLICSLCALSDQLVATKEEKTAIAQAL